MHVVGSRHDELRPVRARPGDHHRPHPHDLSGDRILEADGTWFFSLDAEKHFPNFATIVTNNDYDDGSDLDREGVYR